MFDQMLYDSLKIWYSDQINADRFGEIILGKKVSLRVYNWFVTNYAKSHNVMYNHIKDNVSRLIIVYHEYIAQCRVYHKSNFDPICRTTSLGLLIPIKVNYNGSETIINTNLAQMAFFKWAISNAVDQYIEKHIDSIKDDIAHFKKSVSEGIIKPKRGRTSASEDSYSSVQIIDTKEYFN